MAYSTGVSLLTAGWFEPSTFAFTSSPIDDESSTSGTVSADVNTSAAIFNSGYDAGFGTLSNTTWTLTSSYGNGIGSYSQSLLNPVNSLTNTLRFTLTASSFAWRENEVSIAATTSTGAIRSTSQIVRLACNYNGTVPYYTTAALTEDSQIKYIGLNDPFEGWLEPTAILINGMSVYSYSQIPSNDFNVDYTYGSGEVWVSLKSERLGTYSTTLNHSAVDSWGIIGAAGSDYSVSATRSLQWYAGSSYSKTSNGIKIVIQGDGDVIFGYGGNDPEQWTADYASSWIGNARVFDILDGNFIQTPALYQIKISHVSGDASWTFSRISTYTQQSTPLNKDQWYDMTYNSAYPDYCVNLTSYDVSGVYSCVVNIQIRDVANTVSYSQNVTLTLTDS